MINWAEWFIIVTGISMDFSSTLFVFYFLPISVAGYFLCHRFLSRAENIYLILISFLFYGWTDYKSVLFLLVISLLLYGYGKIAEGKKNKALLFGGLVLLLGILGYFKYINFVISNLNRFLKMAIQPRELIVPLGISFVIFEAISYLVDVYRGVRVGSLTEVFLFVSLFTKVTSGPILSWKRFEKQTKNRECNLTTITDGAEEVIFGLAKKVLVADILGAASYAITSRFTKGAIDAASAYLAALCYMVQIYYDFSGYSNIAIGISRMFGFRVEKNFNEPYRSTSISEFWRRWHISLGTWFREYLYIPLGGNRRHVLINLFVVFLCTGVWHGAGWNYILWGVMNGVLVVLERLVREKKWYQKIPAVLKQAFVLVFLYVSWIFFSNPSLGEIKWFFLVMLGYNRNNFINFTWKYYLNNQIIFLLLFAIINDVLLPLSYKEKVTAFFQKDEAHVCVKYCLEAVLLILTIIYMVNSTYSPFIYYKF